MNTAGAPPPALTPFATVRVQVGELVSLGDAPDGERRCVPLVGGTIEGPGLHGEVLPGGSDWQWRRADGVLEIDAHYIVRTPDGALVEVRSQGLRHGPPEVMAALARGEAVPPEAYFFRTLMRFATGAPAWQHLNRTLALARGQREARAVLLRAWAIG
jgi:hypothetical protein